MSLQFHVCALYCMLENMKNILTILTQRYWKGPWKYINIFFLTTNDAADRENITICHCELLEIATFECRQYDLNGNINYHSTTDEQEAEEHAEAGAAHPASLQHSQEGDSSTPPQGAAPRSQLGL